MRIFHGFDSLPNFQDSVVTLGSFDGVHGGHLQLLGEVISEAKRIEGESIVITFEPHPRIALQKGSVALLTTIDEKAQLLANYGIDNLIVIPFDESFRQINATDFLSKYIVGKVRAKVIIVGYNHRFGCDHADFAQLRPMCQELGITIEQVEQYRNDDEKVSSTVIRELISRGEMTHAAQLLTHGYPISGEAKDNTIIITNKHKLLPADGDYSAMIGLQRVAITISERIVRICDATIPDGKLTLIL